MTTDTVSKVTIEYKNGEYKLLVNKKPFYIKGAGLEFGNIASLAEHKGNSFRTWRVENGSQTGKEVLDMAFKHGLMVTMGIEVARERHGFDYNDEDAVRKQKESIKKDVLKLKDHPALLIWSIGNELNLRSTNPKVWNAVNDISKMIHEIDPNHPTTTTLAGFSKQDVDFIKTRCTDIDILSIQLYGKIKELPKALKTYNWTGPYIVSEWGATGHWEVQKTSWDAPIEDSSTKKAQDFLNRYRVVIESDTKQCLGSYVFLWGQKQECTPTWYGLFLENGARTQSVGTMRYIWSNKWPENPTPKLISFNLDHKIGSQNIILKPNKEIVASVKIEDSENNSINFKWEVLPESTDVKEGGDYELRPKRIDIDIISNKEGVLKFITPKAGVYRLFVYVYDDFNNAATANIPFKVE